MTDDITIILNSADEINQEHELVINSIRGGLEHACRCGDLLKKQKESMMHGEWLLWIRMNCKFSEWTAQTYMKMASNPRRVTLLEEKRSYRSALKMLAEPKPKPKLTTAQKQVMFSWSEDNNIKAMWEGIKSVKKGVLILCVYKRKDRVVSHYLRQMVKKSLENIIQIIDDWENEKI